jgi:hypothetical protein
MEEHNLEDLKHEEKRPENPGAQMVRWLKPGGCILVLVLTVIAMVYLFTSGRDPIPGYTPPQSNAYYAQHPDELARELSENVLPRLSGAAGAQVSGDKVVVELTGEDYAVARAAILRYYDASLFEFITP